MSTFSDWPEELWPHNCPNCGHESDEMGYWYWPQPHYGVRLGACTECDHLHPVLGKLRPEDFTPKHDKKEKTQ